MTTKTTVQNLASGFISANTNKIKITAFITEQYSTYINMPTTTEGEKAESELVELWNLISANPKDDSDRKKAIASFKSLMNRVTKKVNKDLDNGLRAMVVKDGKLVEAQARGSNSGEGGEGGEEGGNTSTDAPVTVPNLDNFDVLATLIGVLDKVTGEEYAAVKAGIDALIAIDNMTQGLTSEVTGIAPLGHDHDEEAYAERMHP